MKRLLVLSVTVIFLALAGTAAASCSCQKYLRQWFKDPTAQRQFDRKADALGISVTTRKRAKRGVYDWAKQGTFDESWCKAYPRTCKAAAACIIAFAGTVAADKANHASDKKATRDGGIACATAMAGALLIA